MVDFLVNRSKTITAIAGEQHCPLSVNPTHVQPEPAVAHAINAQ